MGRKQLYSRSSKERRLDDNLFDIVQCIKVVQMSEISLWIAFRGIKGAYDSVSQEKTMGATERVGFRCTFGWAFTAGTDK